MSGLNDEAKALLAEAIPGWRVRPEHVIFNAGG